MNRFFGHFVAPVVCAVGMTGTGASAAEVIITYTGSISYGTDDGVFGTGVSDLSGREFTLTYTLNYPLAGAQSGEELDSAFAGGGFAYTGNPTSPLSATFQIGSVSQAVGGSYQGYVAQINDRNGQIDSLIHRVDDRISSSNTYTRNFAESRVSSSINNIVSSTDFTSPLSYTVQAGDTQSGRFLFVRATYDPVTNAQTSYRVASGDLAIRQITISPSVAGAVPEPLAWMLLIVGFGMVGGTMRMRPTVPVLVMKASGKA